MYILPYSYSLRSCDLESALQRFSRDCSCIPAHYYDAKHPYPMCTKEEDTDDCQFASEGFILDGGVRKPCLDTCEGQEMTFESSFNAYPDRKSFHKEGNFKAVIGKMNASCLNEKRPVMEESYPGICNLLEKVKADSEPKHLLGLYEQDFGQLKTLVTEYASDNLIKIDLFIKTPTAKMYERQEQVTFLAFFGYVGGFLGLLLGFSVISFAEVIYFVIRSIERRVVAQGTNKKGLGST